MTLPPYGYSQVFECPEDLHMAFYRDVSAEVSLVRDLVARRARLDRPRILELQCGPALISRALSEDPVEVIAAESSREFLEYARTLHAGAPITWKHLHPTDFELPGTDIILYPLDSYAYLNEDALERSFYRSCARSLAADGLLVIEVNHPKTIGYIDYSQVFPEGTRLLPGREFKVEWAVNDPEIDLRTGCATTEIRFTRTVNGDTKVWSKLSRERYHNLRDIQLMAEGSGFRLLEAFGSYDREPLGPDSPIMVLIFGKEK